MPPEILSSGSIIFLRGRVAFAIDGIVLTILAAFLPLRDRPRFPL